MMRRHGLGLTVWSLLASGFLSGKYTRESLADPENRFSGCDLLPFDKEQGFALVEQRRLLVRSSSASGRRDAKLRECCVVESAALHDALVALERRERSFAEVPDAAVDSPEVIAARSEF